MSDSTNPEMDAITAQVMREVLGLNAKGQSPGMIEGEIANTIGVTSSKVVELIGNCGAEYVFAENMYYDGHYGCGKMDMAAVMTRFVHGEEEAREAFYDDHHSHTDRPILPLAFNGGVFVTLALEHMNATYQPNGVIPMEVIRIRLSQGAAEELGRALIEAAGIAAGQVAFDRPYVKPE